MFNDNSGFVRGMVTGIVVGTVVSMMSQNKQMKNIGRHFMRKASGNTMRTVGNIIGKLAR